MAFVTLERSLQKSRAKHAISAAPRVPPTAPPTVAVSHVVFAAHAVVVGPIIEAEDVALGEARLAVAV